MKNFIKKIVDFIKSHDTLERALQTFWQTFLAVFLVGILPVIDLVFAGDFEGTKLALIALVASAIASGLSALKTYIKTKIAEIK